MRKLDLLSLFENNSKATTPVPAKNNLGVIALGFACFLVWWMIFVAKMPHLMYLFAFNETLTTTLPSPSPNSISSLAQAFILASIAATDQKLLKLYSSRITLFVSAMLLAILPLIQIAIPSENFTTILSITLEATMGGVSAFVLIFWGVAFSRQDIQTASFLICISISLTFCLLLLIFNLPETIQIPITCMLSILSLPSLWSLTPISYAIRRSIPIFNPLPINFVYFFERAVLPMLFMGIAFGLFFDMTLFEYTEASVFDSSFAVILSGLSAIAVCLMSTTLSSGASWQTLTRSVSVVIVSCALILTLQSTANLWSLSTSILPSMLMLSFVWIYCSQIAENFRLSPILVFGTSFCGIAFGVFFSYFFANSDDFISQQISFLAENKTIFAMACASIALSLTVTPRIIKKMVTTNISRNVEIDIAGELNTSSILQKTFIANETEELQTTTTQKITKEASKPIPETLCDETKTLNTTALSSKTPETSSQNQPTGQHIKMFRLKCEIIANNNVLSARETEVLFFVAKGFSTNQIAEKLFISRNTAKTHITHIYRKLNVHNKEDLGRLVNNVYIDLDED